jgi:hypothetical protein
MSWQEAIPNNAEDKFATIFRKSKNRMQCYFCTMNQTKQQTNKKKKNLNAWTSQRRNSYLIK